MNFIGSIWWRFVKIGQSKVKIFKKCCKFRYCKKATIILLNNIKTKCENFSNFLAFSEYLNFKKSCITKSFLSVGWSFGGCVGGRDATRDGWIKEFIKRKWSSGLFRAVWDAEKKKLPQVCNFLGWFFQL